MVENNVVQSPHRSTQIRGFRHIFTLFSGAEASVDVQVKYLIYVMIY